MMIQKQFETIQDCQIKWNNCEWKSAVDRWVEDMGESLCIHLVVFVQALYEVEVFSPLENDSSRFSQSDEVLDHGNDGQSVVVVECPLTHNGCRFRYESSVETMEVLEKSQK